MLKNIRLKLNFSHFILSSLGKKRLNRSSIAISLMLVLMVTLSSYTNPFHILDSFAQTRQKISLKAILVEPRDRWDILLPDAIKILKARHPELDINLNYSVLPYADGSVRKSMQNTIENEVPIDLISVDQIWLGDFAEKGLLSDLTNRTEKWGRLSDWYQSNLDGMTYKDKIYGIWIWTDQRMVWYWKDLLQKASIDANSLKTWNGFIAASKKLNDVLKDQGIQGVQLICGGAEWYPYLWIQKGEIFRYKDGHPTKGRYWFPAFNGTEGINAVEFFRDIINTGISPQTENFESNFANRKFAIYIGGSWIPASFPTYNLQEFQQRIGLNPGYPVPHIGNMTTTVMGGWEMGIPETSKYKDLAWELITIMTSPDVLSNMLKQTGYLPTQVSIGDGPYSALVNSSVPYYHEMISMIPMAKARPVIPEFPEIDGYITQSLSDVCSGKKEPKQALNEAAAKTSKLLGW
jgi:multiple sugar transport system substrate-binding protein